MDWYYAEDNRRQKGPLTQEAFDALVREGVILPDTLVWNETMENWQPFAHLTTGAPESAIDAPTETTIPATATFAHPEEFSRAVCERGYRIEISHCLSRAWTLMQTHFPLLIGATALVLLIQLGIDFLIPVIGSFVALVLHGPLSGGLYAAYLKIMRREEATMEDVFSGFGPRAVQLVFAGVVPSLAVYCCLAPAAIYGMATGELDFSAAQIDPTQFSGTLWLLGLAALIPITYVSIIWVFVIPLVMDKQLGFWDAMQVSRRVVHQHWWQVFLLVLVGSAVGAVGILFCFVGFFATLPLFYAMFLWAYEDIFGGVYYAADGPVNGSVPRR